MPIVSRDKESGALIFTPEPHEVEIQQNKEDINSLKKEIATLKGLVTKLTNRVKELEASQNSGDSE